MLPIFNKKWASFILAAVLLSNAQAAWRDKSTGRIYYDDGTPQDVYSGIGKRSSLNTPQSNRFGGIMRVNPLAQAPQPGLSVAAKRILSALSLQERRKTQALCNMMQRNIYHITDPDIVKTINDKLKGKFFGTNVCANAVNRFIQQDGTGVSVTKVYPFLSKFNAEAEIALIEAGLDPRGIVPAQ